MEKKTIYIVGGIGLALLLLSFKNKDKVNKTIQKSIIDQTGKPAGQKVIWAIPQATLYNSMFEPIWTNNSDSYIEMSVTGESIDGATFNVVYGMDFMNGLPAIIFKADTTII